MTAARVAPGALRELFLFEALQPEQLDWLAAHGTTRAVGAGTDVFAEGQPATEFFVLLSGTIALSRRVQRDDVELTRTDGRGAYAGATVAWLRDGGEQHYNSSLHAITDVDLFFLPAPEFVAVMQRWFPMAMHLLEGLYVGIRNSNNLVGARERLIALGSLSAGLTHELNNPAAAAVRATATLRERLAGMRRKLAMLAAGDIDPEALMRLTDLQETAITGIPAAAPLTTMQTSEREDEVGDWLAGHGVRDGWDLAPIYVASGLDVAWAEGVAAAVTERFLEGALRWLAYTLETELLIGEIEDAATRISTLVDAAKQYSQMDRAEHQWVDVHDGLDSTLVMLGRKLASVRLVKDYDRTLPKIPAYAAELNQVWTNLIDNALDAMAGAGTLTVRTTADGERLLVEVGDTGPGVPEEVRGRVFEPFFTTKPVGQGTGLGLGISFRIVVNRHGGDLRVDSRPGDTRFQVRLPLREPAPEAQPDLPSVARR